MRPRPSSIGSDDEELSKEGKMQENPFGNLIPALPFKAPNGNLNLNHCLGKTCASGKSAQSRNDAEADFKGEKKSKGKNHSNKGNGSKGKLCERPSLETVVEVVHNEFKDDFESDNQ